MYYGKDDELYGDIEETILACLLLKPKLMEELKVEEKHFKKFGYILTFFKSFYTYHKNLDVALMFSTVKSTSEMALLDTITYLGNIFVIPTHFEEYQKQLLLLYNQDKKEDWLRRKIYDKATKLLMGSLDIKGFNKELKKLYEQAEKIDWR